MPAQCAATIWKAVAGVASGDRWRDAGYLLLPLLVIGLVLRGLEFLYTIPRFGEFLLDQRGFRAKRGGG